MNAADEVLVELALKRALVTPEQVSGARSRSGLGESASPLATGTGVLAFLFAETPGLSHAVAEALSEEFGLPRVRSLGSPAPLREVLAAIPATVARQHRVFPVGLGKNCLRIAIDNPFDEARIESLKNAVQREVELVSASSEEIETALDLFYPIDLQVVNESEAFFGAFETVSTATKGGSAQVGIEEKLSLSGDEPIIKVVGALITDAIKRRASDIHLEPMAGRFRVRNRVDGVLLEVNGPALRFQPAVISRVKIMANLSIAEKRVPQDGRIRWQEGGSCVDLRVSTLPSTHGESVVMRILNGAHASLDLGELGMDANDRAIWERLISLSDGMLLVTGPTGSGKTTTLYSLLNTLNHPRRKIVTVEDPVEYQISGINQVPVRPEIGMTFAHALRALLRQAPNILMIGEIRDRETAEIAANAAQTGHLVFSTLHTNDACGALARLTDLGVPSFMVSAALRGVLAQRLVRRICERCKRTRAATFAERSALGAAGGSAEETTVAEGAGCVACNRTGYRGRVGLFELLAIDREMQLALLSPAGVSAIRKRWRSRGGRTLREDGLSKVRSGLTTLQEVISATVRDDINSI